MVAFEDPTAKVRVASPRVGTRPHGLVRQCARSAGALLTVTVALMLASAVRYPAGGEPEWLDMLLGFAGLAAMAASAVAFFAQVVCWIDPRRAAGFTVGDHYLVVDGRRFIARANVETGWVLRGPDGARVELRLRGGDVSSAATATPEEAAAVLDAVGVDASRRALRLPLGGPVTDALLGLGAAPPLACVAAVIALLLRAPLHLSESALGALMVALWGVLTVGAVRALRPPVVAVGRDGVAVTGALGSWFVPFGEVAAVSPRRFAIKLTLRNGGRRTIATYGTSRARREALAARIAEGVAAQESADLSVRLAALDANGRTAEAWMAALRALAAPGDDYRRTGLTRDEIQAALDDPRTSPERRVGAAFALAAFDPQLAVTRVRVAAETAAHEPVRVALARAAGGDIDAAAVAAVRAAK